MVRCFCLVFTLILASYVCADAQQPFHPWRPTPFQPKVTPPRQNEVEALRKSAALQQMIRKTADKKYAEEAKIHMKQRLEAVRALAKRLEQTTEESLTQGGTLRHHMIEAKVDTSQVDFAMKELKDGVPKMREAGRAINRELEKMGGVK